MTHSSYWHLGSSILISEEKEKIRQYKRTFHTHAFRSHIPMASNTYPFGKRLKVVAGCTRAQKREEPNAIRWKKRIRERKFRGHANAKGKQDVRRTLIPPSKRDSVRLELFLRGRGGGHWLYVVCVFFRETKDVTTTHPNST